MIDTTEISEGSDCPKCGAAAAMISGKSEGCSCHINPPCSACINAGCVCGECGFDTAEDWKEARRQDEAYEQKERIELAKIEARIRSEKRGKRRNEVTHTHVANPFNSTPFTNCCGVAAINESRCPNCEAEILGHDDGLSARRREVGPGNCLMCGKSRSKALQPGGCCC